MRKIADNRTPGRSHVVTQIASLWMRSCLLSCCIAGNYVHQETLTTDNPVTSTNTITQRDQASSYSDGAEFEQGYVFGYVLLIL